MKTAITRFVWVIAIRAANWLQAMRNRSQIGYPIFMIVTLEFVSPSLELAGALS